MEYLPAGETDRYYTELIGLGDELLGDCRGGSHGGGSGRRGLCTEQGGERADVLRLEDAVQYRKD